MMARQLLLISLGLVLAVAAGSALAFRSRPDCTNTLTAQGVSFSAYRSICGYITDEPEFNKALKMDKINKLEIIESCACALLNHELAWASMMTRELNVFYEAIKKFVDSKAEQKDSKIKALTNQSGLMFEGEEGKRRYYWDSLDFILKSATGENDDEDISFALRENFAGLYYDVPTFELKFVKMVQSQKLRMILSAVCEQVIDRFSSEFLPLFDRLAQLAGNDYIFYMLTSYNEDLYKLRMTSKACIYLFDKGQLVSKNL